VDGVLVSGAAGSIGRRVIGLLAGDPALGPVVGLDRRPAPAGARVEHHVVDLSRPDAVLPALHSAGTVIHLAWAPESTDPAANPRALARVLELAGRGGVRQVVHLSSATVYGAWPDNPVPLSEDAPLRPCPTFSFALEKAEAERLLAEWAGTHPEVAVAVLRPAVTVGSTGPAIYRALAGTTALQPGDGSRPRQFLHVDDLAAAVALAATARLRGVYNVAPDGWITDDATRQLAGGVAGLRLPTRVARIATVWAWDARAKGTPREALPYAEHPWVVANDRLRAAGWSPRFTNEEALVSADERVHLSDLPPHRRQVLGLVVAGAGVLGAAGAAWAAVTRARRRS
jgi:nucleoside-diphosphate-sugar epimerase